MNILALLSHNFGQKSRTRCPDDAVPFPAGFRGKLLHATDLCVACGTCVYACSPGAIKISNEENAIDWDYTEDRCTFCGFCVQYCPTQALQFATEAPAPITQRSDHYTYHVIELQPCRSCGKPVQWLTDAALEKLYGMPLPPEVAETRGLCEHCRQELTSKRFLKTIVIKGDGKND